MKRKIAQSAVLKKLSKENFAQENLHLSFHKKDPVLNLLLRLNLTSKSIVFYTLLFGLIWRIAIPLIANMNFPPRMDLMTLSFFFIPVAWSFYIDSAWQSSKIFNNIWNKKIIIPLEENQSAFLVQIHKVEKSFSHWIWVLISAVTAIIISVIVFTQFWIDNPDSWINPEKFLWYALIEMVTYTLSQYIVVMIFIREILLNYWLRSLYKKVNIRVLIDDPDRAGGWGQIGNHSAYTSTIIIAFVEWIMASAYFETAQTGFFVRVYLFLFWGLLIAFAPIVFIMPIWSTHNAMQSYKKKLLQDISGKINQVFDLTLNTIENGTVDLTSIQDKLNNLRTQYKSIDEAVLVWPIPSYLFRNIGISWLLPIATALLSAKLETWTKGSP